ncbi:Protein hunchback [Intoshia linei]|uniref:Protein hunchback n=1 Tax=Intoshia linei TaxID=1819745 RepID=A0A177B242_9BILA|nr:Protein hunchback [Intoshia linei]
MNVPIQKQCSFPVKWNTSQNLITQKHPTYHENYFIPRSKWINYFQKYSVIKDRKYFTKSEWLLMDKKLFRQYFNHQTCDVMESIRSIIITELGETEYETWTNKNRQASKSKIFQCRICKSKFSTKIDMWHHSVIHMEKEKIIFCAICPFLTEHKHHLEYHTRNHFHMKPFKCPSCTYDCVNKSMLKSHLKSHFSSETCPTCGSKGLMCKHRPNFFIGDDGNIIILRSEGTNCIKSWPIKKRSTKNKITKFSVLEAYIENAVIQKNVYLKNLENNIQWNTMINRLNMSHLRINSQNSNSIIDEVKEEALDLSYKTLSSTLSSSEISRIKCDERNVNHSSVNVITDDNQFDLIKNPLNLLKITCSKCNDQYNTFNMIISHTCQSTRKLSHLDSKFNISSHLSKRKMYNENDSPFLNKKYKPNATLHNEIT